MPTRSDFLATGSLAMLTPGIAAAKTPSPPPKPAPEPSLPPLHFEVAAFDAALNTAAPHRHLFASTKIDGGVVLAAMRNTLNAYGDIGVATRDVFPVAVLYHGGSVFLAFDDAVWNEYLIPLQPKGARNLDDYAKDFDTVYDPKKRGNPCLHKTGGHEDTSIESLVADAGACFFVCNNAARGFAHYIATHLKKQPAEVYVQLAAHLVPNAMLVPAGVWAVHAIQERRYTLLQTSL
ncbi:MAG: hypothetical protein ABI231_10115 [Candidatus Tumulicola sp.]